MRIALLFVAGLFAAAAAAEESSAARAARYYAEGLERPLQQLRASAQLLQVCIDRLKRACDGQQRELAADSNVVPLLDAFTLFPQRTASDPAAGVTRARDLKSRLAATDAAFMREVADYDLTLFARYGATLRACPLEERATEYLESLAALVELHLSGFQALDAAATAEATETYTRRENELASRLRAGSHEDCVAARTLGEDLMRLMDSKLQPWNVGDPDADDPARAFDFNQPVKPKGKDPVQIARERERAEAVARNFVTVVATELQLTAFPESAARIKEIAERDGLPSQD
ncbi:MAG TPA: hypothetical protein VM146_18345 [Steroidobacteraceae bacterium]|nr:hypothetical protein [Steroidobacteraceae bacterium]